MCWLGEVNKINRYRQSTCYFPSQSIRCFGKTLITSSTISSANECKGIFQNTSHRKWQIGLKFIYSVSIANQITAFNVITFGRTILKARTVDFRWPHCRALQYEGKTSWIHVPWCQWLTWAWKSSQSTEVAFNIPDWTAVDQWMVSKTLEICLKCQIDYLGFRLDELLCR